MLQLDANETARFDFINSWLKSCEDIDWEDRCSLNDILNTVKRLYLETDFFILPSSLKYHGAYRGGLFDHSFRVAESLIDFTKKMNLKWQREASPFIVGFFHDLCKVDDYEFGYDAKEETTTFVWNKERAYKSHGEKSVLMLSSYMTLTEEEVACITYHMGAFTDKEDWQYYGRAVEMYPNVAWTHHADMLESKANNKPVI